MILFFSYKNSLDPAKSYFGHLLSEEEKETSEENIRTRAEIHVVDVWSFETCESSLLEIECV